MTDSKTPARLEPAIEASGLTKTFGDTHAVDGVDLTIPAGTVYGFLGPNGAGKTTTLRILATLLRPDGGSARVLGYDVVRDADRVRRRIALTGQSASLDEDLTGFENLVLLARLWGYRRAQARLRARELIAASGLDDAGDRQVKTYSGGMRRRLDIAASLVLTPALLFLDEPTTGLDPRSRNAVWRMVRDLAEAGTTVLLTTQYLDEADHLADRIAVIDSGKIVAEGTPAALKASVGAGSFNLRVLDGPMTGDVHRIVAEQLGISVHPGTRTGELTIPLDDPARAVVVLNELARAGISVADFRFGRPSLDEVFLALTGRPTAARTTRKEDAA